MLRRKDSKMDKRRTEEEDIDSRLQDAGLYEDGMTLDMKRQLLQMIEESCETAKQEEQERQQLRNQEDQLLNDTLDRSFRRGQVATQDGSDQREEEEDVVALIMELQADPNHQPQTPNTSNTAGGSRSATPSQSQQSIGQHTGTPSYAQKLRQNSGTPSQSPMRPSSGTPSQSFQSQDMRQNSETPSQSQHKSQYWNSNRTPNHSQPNRNTQTPSSSQQKGRAWTPSQMQERGPNCTPKQSSRAQGDDEDLFASDSQSLASSRRRLELGMMVSTSDNQENSSQEISTAHDKSSQETDARQEIVSGSQERVDSSQGSSGLMVHARRPLRESHSQELSPPTPEHSSEKLFSSCGSDSSWQAVHDEVDALVIPSPAPSHKIIRAVSLSSPQTPKSSTSKLQEHTVTSSPQGKLSVKVNLVFEEDENDDGEDYLQPTPEASTSKVGLLRLPNVEADDMFSENVDGEHVNMIKDDIMVDADPLEGSSQPSLVSKSSGSGIDELDSIDFDDCLTFNHKEDWKKNINVFCPDINPSLSMARRRGLEKIEDPSKAYMKHKNESREECRKRILGLISRQMRAILEHQINDLANKLAWSAPITVDRRVKNSLERPRAFNRRQQQHGHQQQRKQQWEPMQASSSNEQDQPRRALRLALKDQPTLPTCDDLLPDLSPADEGWINMQGKRRVRRNGRQMNLPRITNKITKENSPAPSDEKTRSPAHTKMQKTMAYDLDDSDDFEMFPKKLQVKNLTNTPKGIPGSTVSSSSCDSLAEKFERKEEGMEVVDDDVVPDSPVISLENEENAFDKLSADRPESRGGDHQERPPPATYRGKRGTRKTFMLPSSSSYLANKENSGKAIPVAQDNDADVFVDASDELNMTPQPSTSSAHLSKAKDLTPVTTGTKTWIVPPKKGTPIGRSASAMNSPVTSSGARDRTPVAIGTKTLIIPQKKPTTPSVGRSASAANSPTSQEISEDVSITEEIMILDKEGSGGPSQAKYPRRESRRGRGDQGDNTIRPAPLKLKKQRIKADGGGKTVTASGSGGGNGGGGGGGSGGGGGGGGSHSTNQASSPQDQSASSDDEMEGATGVRAEELEEQVPCPLCQKLFPLEKIDVLEIHAATCEGIVETSQPETKERAAGRGNNNNNTSRRGNRRGRKRKTHNDVEVEEVSEDCGTSGTGREGVGEVSCAYCKVVFPEGDDFLIHTRECEKMKTLTNTILTPGSRQQHPGGQNQRRQRGGAGSSQPRLFRREDEPRGGGGGGESLFDHLEAEGVCCEQVSGDLLEPAYQHPNIALVQIINCVATKPHGLSQVLADRYPYCNSYSQRRPIDRLNRAIKQDRPEPGSIKVCHPGKWNTSPIVVNLCGQFYMGKESQKNSFAMKILNQRPSPKSLVSHAPDMHLLNGIYNDTAGHRIQWFREGLDQIERCLGKDIQVNQIVFPWCIGCGLAGGDWQKDYLPAIKSFAARVAKAKVKVKIVKKEDAEENMRKSQKKPRKNMSDREMAMLEFGRMNLS